MITIKKVKYFFHSRAVQITGVSVISVVATTALCLSCALAVKSLYNKATQPKPIIKPIYRPIPEESLNTDPDIKNFLSLSLSNNDQLLLKALLEPLATWSPIKLFKNKSTMKERGRNTRHINILRALDHISSNSELMGYINSIRGSKIKWRKFITIYEKSLKIAHSKGQIEPHLAGFAKRQGIPVVKLESLVQKSQWDQFLKLFI